MSIVVFTSVLIPSFSDAAFSCLSITEQTQLTSPSWESHSHHNPTHTTEDNYTIQNDCLLSLHNQSITQPRSQLISNFLTLRHYSSE